MKVKETKNGFKVLDKWSIIPGIPALFICVIFYTFIYKYEINTLLTIKETLLGFFNGSFTFSGDIIAPIIFIFIFTIVFVRVILLSFFNTTIYEFNPEHITIKIIPFSLKKTVYQTSDFHQFYFEREKIIYKRTEHYTYSFFGVNTKEKHIKIIDDFGEKNEILQLEQRLIKMDGFNIKQMKVKNYIENK